MEWSALFFVNSILLGIGLAMDAFSVCLVNGLNERAMTAKRAVQIGGIFAFFQGFMPMLGWLCVHTILEYFQMFERYIPWIALALLVFIGSKMLVDGMMDHDSTAAEMAEVGFSALLVQGIATSIDALSVGFTIAEYGFPMALMCALMIAAVTFLICMVGLEIGKKVGGQLSGKATILGGILLIFIGIEIFFRRS